MQEIMRKEEIKIEDMIYEINGIQVMVDSDLAKLYKCKNGTKEINQAVKNNPNKFPNRYSWILNEKESNDLLVKIFDQKNIETRGGRFKNPRVFTEQGIAMLATILHTEVATEISIAIMDSFVKMRHFIKDNADVFKSLNIVNNKLAIHDEKLDYLFSKFDKKEQLFLKGQIFEAYINVLDLLNQASNEIIIVDNYADVNILDLIKNIKSNITLITRDSDRLNDIMTEKYNEEYHNLKVIRNNNFHDRFIVIDNKEIYILGTSLNSIGEKTTFIVKINDINIIKLLQKRIDNIKK